MKRSTLAIATALCLLPLSALAHKAWLLPSQTVAAGDKPVITVDAAVSNDLFYFNHVPLRGDFVITAPDGSAVGQREAGWGVQPTADEFARLEPNRVALEAIASQTKGELVAGEDLESFVAGLPARGAPVTEAWVVPLWHHALYFLVTIVCLTAEWGLRRVNGLA